MDYSRRKNDSLIHTFLNDMKKMDAVVTRLQHEINNLRTEVQELRESVSPSFHEPKQEDTYTPSHHPSTPHTGWSRETVEFEKQKESPWEHGNQPTTHSSNPWDDRGSTRRHHTVSHF